MITEKTRSRRRSCLFRKDRPAPEPVSASPPRPPLDRPRATTVRLVAGRAPGDRPVAIAEVMSDGTIRPLDRADVPGGPAAAMESGVLGGDGWTLWWQRRRWG